MTTTTFLWFIIATAYLVTAHCVRSTIAFVGGALGALLSGAIVLRTQ